MTFSIYDCTCDFFRSNRNYTIAYIGLSFVFPIVQIVLPHYYGKLIENVNNRKKLVTFIAIVAILWILNAFLYWGIDKLDTYFIPKFQSHIRIHLISQILKSYSNSIIELPTGEIMGKIIKLPVIMRDLFQQCRRLLLPTFLVMMSALGYFFWIHKSLGFVFLIGSILFFSVTRGMERMCTRNSGILEEHHGKMAEIIEDVLNNILNVYTSSMTDSEIEYLKEVSAKVDEHYVSTINCTRQFKFLFNGITILLFATMIGTSYYLFSKKQISSGTMISIFIVMSYVINLLNNFSSEIRDFTFNMGVLIKIEDYLSYLDKISVTSKIQNITENYSENKSNTIVFKDVTFVYDTTPIFKNLNLEIPTNVNTLVYGPIGSGKSTLLKLILGLLSPSSGKIRLNLEPPSVFSSSKIVYIPQTPRLFSRTIYDNMVYGLYPKPSLNLVWEKLSDLQLQNIFGNKPESLEKFVGKFGNKMSGGQKQIIHFVRGYLSSKPILLFDEPTSNLDAQLKSFIENLLFELCKIKTCIVISHDVSLRNNFENVIELVPQN